MKNLIFALFILVALLAGCKQESQESKAAVFLTLIPPSFLTDQVPIDIRGGIKNNRNQAIDLECRFYLDREDKNALIHDRQIRIAPDSSMTIAFKMPATGLSGNHKILMTLSGDIRISCVKPFTVKSSEFRSPERINGAWAGFYHWSETEGRLWNHEISKMTNDDWAQLVKAMHRVKMDIIVIQEVFRNQEYVHKHNIPVEGYKGKAFYPSDLYPGRMPIAASDPVEAVLGEADSLGMNVFIGTGLYAWFDFSEGSLDWHKGVATELWKKYGHHPSFYGWYISEEIEGGLGDSVQEKDIVLFFRDFRKYVNRFAPGKPVMLATNCHNTRGAEEVYHRLLPNLDILCPFGFHRMPENDLSGEEVAAKLQGLCDEHGTHLWIDMEAFLFANDGALYPRPIEGMVNDMKRFKNFEQILIYQFPGLLCSPEMKIKPGGEAAVKLYLDYRNYLEGKLNF